MKTRKEQISRWTGGASTILLLLLLASPDPAKATDYIFNLTTGTATWTTTSAWTPNGTPGPGDNIDATAITSAGATLTLGGTTQTISNLTKTVAFRWNISGGTTGLSTLNVSNITLATDNMIFFNGNSAGGLVVNAGDITVNSGGVLYFGSTSLSASNLSRGLTVSGTTTINGTGALRMNVSNTSGNSYSLGLLNVNNTGIATLNNAPAGKTATTANVTGLSGTGGAIQAVLAASEYGLVATLAVTNTGDHSSAAVLRDGPATTNGGTLLLTKAGAGTQTLTGANSHTGATTITNGVLRLQHASALGGRAGIMPGNTDTGTNVSSTGTLDLGGQTGVIEVIRLNGTGFGGAGALVNTGAAASIGNGVASLTQTAAGSLPATLTISGGGGAGATGTVSMGVTSATFTINGGTTTYSAAPSVTISGGGGTGATATAILTGGIVTGITVTVPGSGYTSAPTISFSGGTVTAAGTNPSGSGNATNFTPSSYTITSTGSGFTSAPTVSFSGGTFAATASLSGIVLMGNSSIGGSGDIIVDGVVSEDGGARVLTKVGTNVLTLANAGNSYSGGTIINAGSVSIASDTALGTAPATATAGHLTLNGGALSTTADLTLDAGRGLSLGASGGTIDVASATTLTYGGVAEGAGGLTKAGTGTLALSGASSHMGTTTVNAGILAISNGTALGTTAGGTTVAGSATLQLSGGITVGEEPLSLTGDGAAAGIGALQNLSGSNTWNGDVTITAGATRINADAGSLLITGDVGLVGTSGNFNVGGAGDVEISGLISGGLQLFKSSVGGGTVTLSNPNNTYTNHTTVAAGTLRISTEGNLGTTPASFSSVKLRVRSGGTLQTTADMSISTNRGITISNGGGAISPDAGTTLTVNSRITGTVSDTLAKTGAGRLVLTADNTTFLGAMDVTHGSVQAGVGGIGRTGTGAITLRAGSTLLGTGIVQGSSLTAESGASIHAGDGTGQGDHGTLTFTPVAGSGAIDFQTGSLLILGLNPAGGVSDLLNIVGTGSTTLSFNGSLVVGPALLVPTQQETFNLLDWSGLATAPVFASQYSSPGLLFGNGDESAGLDLPDVFGSGYGWDISSLTTNGSIALVLVPEPCRFALLALGMSMLLTRRSRCRK
ncbi:MAG: beta strand repeat-containing protein [Prosthecobacter sp.]